MPIKAGSIKATNVVEGVQIISKEMSEQLIKTAAESASAILASGHSGITADTITADNVVEGVQFIQDTEHPKIEELRQEIAAKFIALSKDTDAPLEAKVALAAVQEEASKEKPEPSKFVQTVEKLSATFKNITDAAPNVLKIARWVPTIYAAVKAWATLNGLPLP